jgi:hypothetical protein
MTAALRKAVQGLVLAVMLLLLHGHSAGAAERPAAAPVAQDHYLSGSFTLRRTLVGFDRPLLSDGRFVLAPAQGLLWETLHPFPSRLLLAQDGIFKLAADGQRQQLGSPDQAALVAGLMASVLGGRWDQLDAAFTLTPLDATPDSWHLRLQPRPGALLDGMVTAINVQGGRFVRTLVVHKASGDSDTITLNGQAVLPLPLPADSAALFKGPVL